MAYFTDAVYSAEMDHLSFALKHGVKESRNLKLPRQFQVLRDTIKKLARFYSELHTGIPYNLDFLLPKPCVISEDGTVQSVVALIPHVTALKFEKRLFTTEGRGMFEGTITCQDTQPPSIGNADAAVSSVAVKQVEVFIKFVDRYGEEAHQLLSDAGLAPKLHWCGPVSGHVSTMVVMDKIEGETLQSFLDKGFPVTDNDLQRVDVALGMLHNNQLVHGDIRPPNVMLCPSSEPGTAHVAYLIDFDWAGKEGVVKYPGNLNPRILWPPRLGTQIFAVILCGDDTWMREHLKNQSKPSKSRDQFPWMRTPSIAAASASHESALLKMKTAEKRPHDDDDDEGSHPQQGPSAPALKRSRDASLNSLMLPPDFSPLTSRRTPSPTTSRRTSVRLSDSRAKTQSQTYSSSHRR